MADIMHSLLVTMMALFGLTSIVVLAAPGDTYCEVHSTNLLVKGLRLTCRRAMSIKTMDSAISILATAWSARHVATHLSEQVPILHAVRT